MNKIKIGLMALLMASFVACTNSETQEATTEEHMHEHGDMDHHDMEATEMAEGKYSCPMACEGDKTYDEAGKCPVCEMDLELASAE